jgi:hypothetical protein
VHSFPEPLPFPLHEPRQSVFPSLSRPAPATIDEQKPKIAFETYDLYKRGGPEALIVEEQVGQPLTAVPDQGLRAYPLRDMPEIPR